MVGKRRRVHPRSRVSGQGEHLVEALPKTLREEFGVYLIRSGRMCVAGLNTRNVVPTALAMASGNLAG